MKQKISNDELLNVLNVIKVGLGYLYLLAMHPDALPIVPIVSQWQRQGQQGICGLRCQDYRKYTGVAGKVRSDNVIDEN